MEELALQVQRKLLQDFEEVSQVLVWARNRDHTQKAGSPINISDQIIEATNSLLRSWK
jgi:hypothetical protein